MTDAGMLSVAVALYFGLKAIADALRNRKVDVTVPGSIEWNVRLHDDAKAPRP